MHLSIITPSYNPGGLILEAAESLAAAVGEIKATFPDVRIEHIITDDGSDDAATLEAYSEIRKRYDFCRIEISRSKKQGPAAARNRAISAAGGAWIGFLDADDLIHPHGLKALVGAALSHADARWVIGDTTVFHPDGTEEERPSYCRRLLPAGSAGPLFVPASDLTRLLAGPPNLFLGSMIVRRDLLEEAGGFDESLICSEDWYLTLTMSLSSPAYYVPQPVERLRRGAASLTQSPTTLGTNAFRATWRAIRDKRFASVRRVLRWTLLTQISNVRRRCFAAGRRWRAFGFGLLAWCVAPENPRLLGDAVRCLTQRAAEKEAREVL